MNKDIQKLRLFIDTNISLFRFSKLPPKEDSKLATFLINEFCRKQIIIEIIPRKIGGKYIYDELQVDDNKYVEEAKQLSFVQKRLIKDQIELEEDEETNKDANSTNKRRFPKFYESLQKIESIDLFNDHKNVFLNFRVQYTGNEENFKALLYVALIICYLFFFKFANKLPEDIAFAIQITLNYILYILLSLSVVQLTLNLLLKFFWVDFWLFPNLNEDVSVVESFIPIYTIARFQPKSYLWLAATFCVWVFSFSTAALCYLDEDFRYYLIDEIKGWGASIVAGSHVLMSDIAKYIIKEPENEQLMSFDYFENMNEDDIFTGRRKKKGMKGKY
eukprot:Mrub_04859.p1 GENE.Mrub_04859~~Mrub_04859.p1  ORF type:complete len:387 (+),score=48.35 Mrub_04859:167-1162(+)